MPLLKIAGAVLVVVAAEIVNTSAGVVVPPDDTVTFAAPVAVVKDAGTAAVSVVEDENVVVRPEPFHTTCAVWLKPVPVTASVNAAPPAVALKGFNWVNESALAPEAMLPVKFTVADCGEVAES